MEEQKVVGKKLAIGKSNSIKQYNVESLHAEMDVLKKLPRHYLSYGLDMIVVRFSSNGDLCSSRPCYHCLKTMTKLGVRIKNIYYSNDGKIMKEKFSEMFENKLTTISSGMRRKNICCQ